MLRYPLKLTSADRSPCTMNLWLCWIEPAYDFSCLLDVGGSTDALDWGIGEGADEEVEASVSDVAFSVPDEAVCRGGE